ncbi:MAG TPA: exodeoxyribonuclease VII large subunit [Gemmataceae bacterium]|nr:exodeoxyribonuclease VII large subunit [Gemmataceae bacterium]
MVPLAPPNPTDVLTVSALTRRVRETIEGEFGSVWVAGEVSNLARPSSGHLYLSLKDDKATLRAVIYRGVALRLRFDLRDGMEVVARGRLTVYEPRGDYQLAVEEIHPKGIGALELALQQLKEKLQAKGYFDARRKRTLPSFPRAIALVTSPTGAAIRDMLELLARRWPVAAITVVPVRVQGDGAAAEIATAIRLLNRLQADGAIRLDALIVGRGGGSLEDLWAFNEELVADAIFGSKIPVVSAVGHEIDVTISDLVADHRALTPSHAITDLTPDRAGLIAGLADIARRLRDRMDQRLYLVRQRLDALAERRAFRQPLDRVRDLEKRLDDLDGRLARAARQSIARHRERLAAVAGKLSTLSPLNVLARGYSLTHGPDGRLLRDASTVHPGDTLSTRLAAGEVVSRVESVRPGPEDQS